MPVVAVGAALYAGATIATVGVAAMSTMAVISAVGAIAAGVGVVTGNKALTQIGAVAGIVGGVGAFAQGQGWLSGDLAGGADAAGVAAEAATGGAEAASNTSNMIAEAAPGVVDPSAGLVASADPSSATYTNAMDMASDAAGAGGDAAAAAAGGAGGGLMNTPLSPLAPQDVKSWGPVAPVKAGSPATSSSIFDTIGKVGDFLGKNKELASLGLNFVGGLFDEKAEAEGDYLKSGIELNMARTAGINTQTDIMKQQAANGNAVPDMTGLKVKPGSVYNTAPPPVYMAPRAGLINSTGR